MRHCSKARRWFGAYWDDEITQAEREWLEGHLADCEACRVEYDELAHALESVASLPRQEAALDFVERTLARARRAAPVSDHLQLPRPAWAPITVAASLLIVAGTLRAPWVERGVRPTAGRTPSPHEAQLVASAVPPAQTPAGSAPTSPALATPRATSQQQVAALVDSLIDHSADVDFVLDPVRVSRERPAGRLVGPAVKGQQAVITF